MKKRILILNFILLLVIPAVAQTYHENPWANPPLNSPANDCDPQSVPYLEDFETTSLGSMPDCFTSESNSGTWRVENVSHTDLPWNNNILMFNYNWSSGDYNAWFFLPGIQLQSGETYLLEYQYGGESNQEEHRTSIWIGSLPESGEMNTEIADFPPFSGVEVRDAEVFFTVPQDGVYYIGFYLYSEEYNGNCFLDNIKLDIAPTCIKPQDLAIDPESLTTTSVDLSWTPTGDESAWLVKYGTPGFDPDTEGEAISANDTQIALTDLSDNTAYEVYVRAECDDEESLWSNSMIFWTACNPTTVPFFQDFEGVNPPEIPNCAVIENASSGNNWDVFYDPYYGFYSNVLRYNYSNQNPANAWYYTQGIEMEANKNYYIKYKYANNASYTTEKLRVALMSETSATSMVEELADHPSIQNQIVYTNEVVFTVPSDGVYYFGFNAYSDQNNYFLLVDDIEIDEAPSCLKPTEVYTDDDNITQTSALISWQDANNASQWEIVFGAPGFDPENEGTTVTINNDTPEGWIENLSPGTTYEVYVRTICSDEDQSALSYSTTFISECDVATVPYVLDFEDAPVPNLPNCTFLENNAYGYDWETAQVNLSGFDSKVLKAKVHYSTPSDVWFFTKAIELEAGVDYTISYDYGIYTWMSPPNAERFKVVLTNEPISTAIVDELSDHPNVVELSVQSNETTFTVSETGTYHIGIQFYSGSHIDGELYIDNIAIDFAPCTPPENIEINDVETTTAQVSWTAGSTETQWEVVYGISGFDPNNDGTTLQAGETTLILENLLAATTYDVYVAAVCHENNKSDFADVVTFTTEAEPCIAPTDIAVANIENHTAAVSWTAGGNENNWEVNYGLSPFDPQEEGNTISVSDQPEAVLENLEGGSIYDLYVRSVCDNENSDWVGPVQFTTTTVGIHNAAGIDVAVYPNPFDNLLTVKADEKVNRIVIYDLTGRIVFDQTIASNTAQIAMNDFVSGIYLMEIFT